MVRLTSVSLSITGTGVSQKTEKKDREGIWQGRCQEQSFGGFHTYRKYD